MPVLRVRYEPGAHSQSTLLPYPELSGGRCGLALHLAVLWTCGCRVAGLGMHCWPPSAMNKRMAALSSTLAWKIPWTEESGGPQSMGSQRVEHNWTE